MECQRYIKTAVKKLKNNEILYSLTHLCAQQAYLVNQQYSENEPPTYHSQHAAYQ